ncbi:MAG: hypothetical protein ACM3X3_09070 [Betaproteobacteria bacterium]
MMVARCDSCKAEFEPRVLVKREGEVETTYFTCPQCGKEYIVCRTTPELRKMQQLIERRRSRLTKQRQRGTLKPEALVAFQELVREYKTKMDAFNGKGLASL